MEIGGSQLIAIELAAKIAERGADVVVFGPKGNLVPLAEGLGLEYIRAPHENSWPSPRNIAEITRIVRNRKIELVHGYEWGPSVELAFGAHLIAGVPLVTTVLSMSVPGFLPRASPMIVGTAELADQQCDLRSDVHLMEPPVDTLRNAPRNNAAARRRFGLDPADIILAIVCRLTDDLDKLEGVRQAIRVTANCTSTPSIRLLIAGDGAGLNEITQLANTANQRAGRDVVVVAGGVLDPSDAYAAADIVLGMGSSALKGMAFGKPLVVQGAAGYWRLLDETSIDIFLAQGWYGNCGSGEIALAEILAPLLAEPSRRRALGELGRDLVTARYSLDAAADQLLKIYAGAIEHRVSERAVRRDIGRTTIEMAKFKTHRFVELRRSTRLRPASPSPIMTRADV